MTMIPSQKQLRHLRSKFVFGHMAFVETDWVETLPKMRLCLKNRTYHGAQWNCFSAGLLICHWCTCSVY